MKVITALSFVSGLALLGGAAYIAWEERSSGTLIALGVSLIVLAAVAAGEIVKKRS